MGSIVGYRFHPTPEELVNHFLRKKRLDPDFSVQKIKEVNIYDYEPHELPGLFPVQPDGQDCHFFCAPDYKYGNSKRVNRRTRGGNWKVTGKKRDIKGKHKRVIGWKITLVFYRGSGNTKEAKTNWVMHEYHINHDSRFKGEFVVVRIKRNPVTKHNTPSTSSNGGVPSPNMISNSGNHNLKNIGSQAKLQPQQEPQSQACHEIPFNRKSQLLPNCSFSGSGETQPVANGILYGNSQLLPNYNEQDDQRKSQPAVQNGQETGQSHPLSFNSSEAVIESSVYYGSNEAISALLNDGSEETIKLKALLNGFSCMGNEYELNSMYQSQVYPPDGNIVPGPAPMGSVF